VQRNVFFLFGSLGFINPSVNPVIYAARYEVFKRYIREMGKSKVAPNITNATAIANNATD